MGKKKHASKGSLGGDVTNRHLRDASRGGVNSSDNLLVAVEDNDLAVCVNIQDDGVTLLDGAGQNVLTARRIQIKLVSRFDFF